MSAVLVAGGVLLAGALLWLDHWINVTWLSQNHERGGER